MQHIIALNYQCNTSLMHFFCVQLLCMFIELCESKSILPFREHKPTKTQNLLTFLFYLYFYT